MLPQPLIVLLFAPLAHMAAKQLLGLCLLRGGQACISSEPAKVFLDAAQLQPTFFTAVPRVYQLLYQRYQQLCMELSHRKAKLCCDCEPSQVEVLAAKEVRSLLGKRLQFMVVGGAACDPLLLQFLRRLFSCEVYDGYGLTETGGIATNGVINADVEVKLVDAPELGYTTKDLPFPRGEICVRTHTMSLGYLQQPSSPGSSDTIDSSRCVDGFFRTGDIGQLSTDGRVTVIDRRANIVKLAQGEFVSLERLESLYQGSPLVHQICIHAFPFASFLLAVVVPDWQACWSGSPEPVPHDCQTQSDVDSAKDGHQHRQSCTACTKPNVRALILRDLSNIAQQAQLRAWERIRGVVISSTEFSVERHFMTESMKMCRRNIAKAFESDLKALYHSIQQTLEALKDIASAVLEPPDRASSHEAQTFFRAGGDSLTAVQFQASVRSTFKQQLPLDVLTLSWLDLAEALTSSQSMEDVTHRHRQWQIEQDIRLPVFESAECALSPQHAGGADSPSARLHQANDIFLTGVTGFVGAHLLQALLCAQQFEGCSFVCLVRGVKDVVELTTLLQERWNVVFSELMAQRLEVVTGDVASPQFGLATPLYSQLTERVGVVFHAAATVNWLLPYSACREANVLGTVHVLQFATARRLKTLHYLSTLAVAGRREGEVLNWQDVVSNGSGYSISKYIAENYVRFAASQGLACSVYRLGMVSGSSETFVCNKNDFFSRYLLDCVHLGVCLSSKQVMDLTPVDCVANYIVTLSTAAFEGLRVLHLHNPLALSFAVMAQHLPFQSQRFEQWLRTVQACKHSHLQPLLPLFAREEDIGMMVHQFDNSVSQQLFEAHGMHFPSITPTLLQGYLSFLTQ